MVEDHRWGWNGPGLPFHGGNPRCLGNAGQGGGFGTRPQQGRGGGGRGKA